MDVILLENVQNLGEVGKVVSVAPGYARNYLLPKGLAMVASPGARKIVAERMALASKQDVRRKEAAEVLAGKFTSRSQTIVIQAKASEEGRLYGSVTTRDIAGALSEQSSLDVDHHHVLLDESIKELGDYEVPVKLHADVQIIVKLAVRQTS